MKNQYEVTLYWIKCESCGWESEAFDKSDRIELENYCECPTCKSDLLNYNENGN